MWLVYCSLPDCCEVGLSHPLATGVRARTTEGKRLRPPLQAVLPAVRLLTAWYDCSLRQLIVYTYTTQSFHANCTRAMHPRPVGAHVSVQEKRVKCVLHTSRTAPRLGVHNVSIWIGLTRRRLLLREVWFTARTLQTCEIACTLANGDVQGGVNSLITRSLGAAVATAPT